MLLLKILFGFGVLVIGMSTVKGRSACDHVWQLIRTEKIKRTHGGRTLTSQSFRCTKCGRTKTTVS